MVGEGIGESTDSSALAETLKTQSPALHISEDDETKLQTESQQSILKYCKTIVEKFYLKIAEAYKHHEFSKRFGERFIENGRSLSAELYDVLYANFHRGLRGHNTINECSTIDKNFLTSLNDRHLIAEGTSSHPYCAIYFEMAALGFIDIESVDYPGYIQYLKSTSDKKAQFWINRCEKMGIEISPQYYEDAASGVNSRLEDRAKILACFIEAVFEAEEELMQQTDIPRSRIDQRFFQYSPITSHCQVLADGGCFLRFQSDQWRGS